MNGGASSRAPSKQAARCQWAGSGTGPMRRGFRAPARTTTTPIFITRCQSSRSPLGSVRRFPLWRRGRGGACDLPATLKHQTVIPLAQQASPRWRTKGVAGMRGACAGASCRSASDPHTRRQSCTRVGVRDPVASEQSRPADAPRGPARRAAPGACSHWPGSCRPVRTAPGPCVLGRTRPGGAPDGWGRRALENSRPG